MPRRGRGAIDRVGKELHIRINCCDVIAPSTGFKELLISSEEKAGILHCSQTKDNLDISQALRYPRTKRIRESKYAGKVVLAYDMYYKGSERFSERDKISPKLCSSDC